MLLALLLALTIPTPPNDHCLLDQAHVIGPAEYTQLNDLCRKTNESGAGQIAFVTTNDLQGSDINEYSNALFHQWGIGHKGKDDGLLILLALPPAKRGIRIEVGYGLEGRLSDGKVMRAEREIAKPDLVRGNYGKALFNLGTYYVGEMKTEATSTARKPPTANPNSSKPDYMIMWVLFTVFGFVTGYFFVFGVDRKKKKSIYVSGSPAYIPSRSTYSPQASCGDAYSNPSSESSYTPTTYSSSTSSYSSDAPSYDSGSSYSSSSSSSSDSGSFGGGDSGGGGGSDSW